ncbi:MAG: hypothetical protein K0B05_09860 [Bacteroidales bacterium]|nr:hypothetical protein [Bacteroidales bacterium]
MPGIIEGYNYDIFISYRQKDNKGEKWVSQFVEALKAELESTFKEEISVYFDVNPHDGLLETHDVDESLKEKLKCLILIPIISRTYCDPKSFAWEHEFKAFVEQASQDEYGLKVKLPNGNVAGRVLPVLIHDLDAADSGECETLLGGVLRGIEFIYREPGINKPLTPDDDEKKNLNNTKYRLQINKTANAIKELITAIESYGRNSETLLQNKREYTPDDKNRRLKFVLPASIFALILVICAFLFLPKLFKSENETVKSIAVLPFKLLSDEPEKQFLADGMMEAITLHLSKINDLRVMSRTSVEQYRGTTKTIRIIGRELDVEYVLEGSFQKIGDDTKLIVQLIKANEESHVWANEFNGKWSDVFLLQSEVSQQIARELMVVLTPEEVEKMGESPTGNLDAYQAFLRGRYYAGQPHFSAGNWNLALQNYQDAAAIDTTFALAFGELAHAHARLIYLRQDMSESRYKMADNAALKALKFGSGQARVHLALGYYYLYAYRDHEQALRHLEIAEKELPGNVDIMVEKADIIVTLGRWDEFIRLLERAGKLSPNDAGIPSELAMGYWYTRRYNKAVETSDKAIALSPASTWPYLYKVFAYWSWKGSCKESRDVIQFIDKSHEWYLFTLYWQEVGDGNYQEALNLMSDTSTVWGTLTKMWAIPKTMMSAFVYDYLHKPELSANCYAAAAKVLEKRVAEVPADPRYHSSLGIAYASFGKKEEAIREGIRAVELLPVSKDAVYGISPLLDLALIYTMTGDYGNALNQIEQLLTIPSWISTVWIEWDIRFAPLWDLPEFKRLVSEFAVK